MPTRPTIKRINRPTNLSLPPALKRFAKDYAAANDFRGLSDLVSHLLRETKAQVSKRKSR